MKRFAFVGMLLLALTVSGCYTERQAQYTTTGAGVGAVTGGILGGILGGISGRPGEGMLVGSIFGGLAGASIGNNEYHLQRSEEDAASYYHYDRQEAQRDLIRVEDLTASPQTVRPGDDVNISATFTMLSPGKSRLVHEVLEIKHDGRVIGKPETTIKRQGGTWVSSIPVRIPPEATPGTYTVTLVVESDTAGDARETSFIVGQDSRWRR